MIINNGAWRALSFFFMAGVEYCAAPTLVAARFFRASAAFRGAMAAHRYSEARLR